MAKYERIVTTTDGLEMMENAAYMDSSIQFTALKTGSGTYDGTEDLSTMTDLKNVCQTFGIGSITKKEGNVIVRIIIDNNDLAEGYKMTELGLYATNPDSEEAVLYAIILAEEGYEDYVPPYADAPTSITFEAFFELTEATEAVTFTAAAQEGVYVPTESFNEHVQDEDVHVTVEEKENWNSKQDELTIDDELSEESENLVTNKAITEGIGKKLDTTGNASNTTVAFSEASELTAPTSGSKLSVLFGIVAKAVSSLISHLADAVSHITSTERTAWNAKSTVAVTRSLTSGTKLGTITIDGTAYDLYCETNTNTTYAVATSSANGLMSKADKAKLDAITENADAVTFTQSLTSGTKVGTININGTDIVLYAPTNTDTKNTSGSTNTSSKIFLIGATSQAANPQTYSHDTCYIGTDGCLYSNSTKVSVEGHEHDAASELTGTLPIANGGTGNTTGLAASATKLATARTIRTNLASTSTASFNGTANVAPGVTGTLPLGNGGTGATTAAAALTNLGTVAVTISTSEPTSGLWVVPAS